MPPDTKVPNNSEIDQALKEFQREASVESTGQPEAQVAQSSNNSSQADTPKIVQLVMKYSGGTIKDERTAEYVLLGFTVLFFGISLYLFFGGEKINSKNIPVKSAEDLINLRPSKQ